MITITILFFSIFFSHEISLKIAPSSTEEVNNFQECNIIVMLRWFAEKTFFLLDYVFINKRLL